MKFLFRVPLFDLDPNSESEITEEWYKILSAIANSSPSLYEEIKKESYSNLAQSLKKKVFKYLLRGRYRSTPFGLWSGVGIGRFDNNPYTTLNLSLAGQLQIDQATEQDEEDGQLLHLSLGGIERLGRVHFLGYMVNEQRWVFVSIPQNPLSSLLLTKLDPSKGISFPEFKTWFDSSRNQISQELWDQLKELGILSGGQKNVSAQGSTRPYVDTVINEQLTLPLSIKAELDTFFETAGGLFSKVGNGYLSCLMSWFQSKFDDRFVALPLLLEYPDFVFSTFLEPARTKSKEDIEPYQFLSKSQTFSIDLKEAVSPKPMDDRIFDLSFVFKKLNSTEIVVENLVCNRPFSFFGRFNRDERIYRYQQELKDKIFLREEFIYAELRVFETLAVAGICDTKPIFDRYISPFCEDDPKAIRLSEIEIGVRSDRFFLFERTSGKRIIPVVTHPLNGKEISHPLIRLLWELELQDTFKFRPYQTTDFSGMSYTPELRWGNLILQSRRWTIQVEDFLSEDQFFRWMNQKDVPMLIKTGNYDRELLLNWREENDFEILWAELVKNRRLTMSEALWHESKEYHSARQRQIHPEFVVNVNRVKKEEDWDGFINSITEDDKSTLYILARIPADELRDFLDFYFCNDLLDYLAQEKVTWYYLVYPEGERLQVRVRYIRIKEETKKQLLWLGYGKLSQEHLDFEIRPYYPEIKKYGKKGYMVSEEVFHLESMLMVNRSIEGKNQVPEPEILLGIVISIWQKFLEAVWQDEQIFKFFREKFRKIPFLEKRQLTINNRLTEKDFKALEPFQTWMELFHRLMLKQISGASNDSEKWRSISNHLHMQVNRFFSLERRNMENTIYLQLYKDYGKKMYGVKS